MNKKINRVIIKRNLKIKDVLKKLQSNRCKILCLVGNNNKLIVDHINNDKLDNTVENLQYITQRLNSSKDKKNTSSIYTGVSWNKEKKKWKSCIRINGKSKHLGYFTDELEASNTYQKAINVSY